MSPLTAVYTVSVIWLVSITAIPTWGKLKSHRHWFRELYPELVLCVFPIVNTLCALLASALLFEAWVGRKGWRQRR